MKLASRNDSLGFAARCKKNLLHIERAFQSREDVHVVTQIVVSSLGLIVFPWERDADQKIRSTPLSALDESQEAMWVEAKPSKGLGQPIKHLRNAIAHGNIHFSSDDRDASKVIVSFGSENGDWQATMSAHNLQTFCLRFIALIEGVIG